MWSECGGMVGWVVREVFAVHRVWWASSRPIVVLLRLGRLSIRLRLSRSQRRVTEKAESSESDDFVNSGRKTPCNWKVAS
jgi:uncharacterized protein YfaT (DUF1175 family)